MKQSTTLGSQERHDIIQSKCGRNTNLLIWVSHPEGGIKSSQPGISLAGGVKTGCRLTTPPFENGTRRLHLLPSPEIPSHTPVPSSRVPVTDMSDRIGQTLTCEDDFTYGEAPGQHRTSVRKRWRILLSDRTGCNATRSRKFSSPTLRRSTKSGSMLSADSLCHTNSACTQTHRASLLYLLYLLYLSCRQ